MEINELDNSYVQIIDGLLRAGYVLIDSPTLIDSLRAYYESSQQNLIEIVQDLNVDPDKITAAEEFNSPIRQILLVSEEQSYLLIFVRANLLFQSFMMSLGLDLGEHNHIFQFMYYLKLVPDKKGYGIDYMVYYTESNEKESCIAKALRAVEKIVTELKQGQCAQVINYRHSDVESNLSPFIDAISEDIQQYLNQSYFIMDGEDDFDLLSALEGVKPKENFYEHKFDVREYFLIGKRHKLMFALVKKTPYLRLVFERLGMSTEQFGKLLSVKLRKNKNNQNNKQFQISEVVAFSNPKNRSRLVKELREKLEFRVFALDWKWITDSR